MQLWPPMILMITKGILDSSWLVSVQKVARDEGWTLAKCTFRKAGCCFRDKKWTCKPWFLWAATWGSKTLAVWQVEVAWYNRRIVECLGKGRSGPSSMTLHAASLNGLYGKILLNIYLQIFFSHSRKNTCHLLSHQENRYPSTDQSYQDSFHWE